GPLAVRIRGTGLRVASAGPDGPARCEGLDHPPPHVVIHTATVPRERLDRRPYGRAGRRTKGRHMAGRSVRDKGEVPPRRVFTRAGLLRMGVSRRRLSSSEFRRVLPGCYTLRDQPADLRQVARIAQSRVVPGGLISHVTAAELLRLPLPDRVT